MRAGEHDAGRNPGAQKKEIRDIFRAAALLILMKFESCKLHKSFLEVL